MYFQQAPASRAVQQCEPYHADGRHVINAGRRLEALNTDHVDEFLPEQFAARGVVIARKPEFQLVDKPRRHGPGIGDRHLPRQSRLNPIPDRGQPAVRRPLRAVMIL